MRASFLGYLRTRRGQVILASFVVSSLLLASLPGIDLSISRLFFTGGFHLRDAWWPVLIHNSLTYFLCVSMSGVVVVYACNKILQQNLFGIDARKVIYLFVVLILGAGLIVNWGRKNNFGRARPRDVVEFGGTKQFTPAFVVSQQCHTNCSFSSGDGAGGFFALALALALSRRRAAYAAALAVGVLVSFARVASGAHFFSDTVVSFFVMLLVADALYYYIVLTEPERSKSLALEPAPAGLAPAASLAEVPAQRTPL